MTPFKVGLELLEYPQNCARTWSNANCSLRLCPKQRPTSKSKYEWRVVTNLSRGLMTVFSCCSSHAEENQWPAGCRVEAKPVAMCVCSTGLFMETHSDLRYCRETLKIWRQTTMAARGSRYAREWAPHKATHLPRRHCSRRTRCLAADRTCLLICHQ